MNGEDILFAMTSLGFENYSEALKIYLSKYREVGCPLVVSTSETRATRAGRLITTCSSLSPTGAKISKVGQVVREATVARAARQDRQTRGRRLSRPVTWPARPLMAQTPTTCINQDTMGREQARAIR